MDFGFFIKQGEVVQIVSDGHFKIGFSSPGGGAPILEGLIAALDGDIPATADVLLDGL